MISSLAVSNLNVLRAAYHKRVVVCYLNAVLCHYSSVARFQVTVLGGSISCLVTLMVLDFGRVVYVTRPRSTRATTAQLYSGRQTLPTMRYVSQVEERSPLDNVNVIACLEFQQGGGTHTNVARCLSCCQCSHSEREIDDGANSSSLTTVTRMSAAQGTRRSTPAALGVSDALEPSHNRPQASGKTSQPSTSRPSA